MEEIRVNEYVRTREGIRKILGKIKTQYIYDKKKIATFDEYEIDKLYKKGLRITKEESRELKHSFNPIELIKPGDYVNGHKVYESDDGLVIFNIDDFEYFVNPMGLELDNYRVVLEWQDENYIKTIVTKEQFESMEHKVGE